MMNLQDIQFLLSTNGRELLSKAENENGEIHSVITRLRSSYTLDQVSAVLNLLNLRKRARKKFALAQSMFFTPEGLEQSSGMRIASWRAQQFPSGLSVIDLCCGIGGDSISLAREHIVYSIDRNPAATLCAAENASICGVQDTIHPVCADVTKLTLKADAAFFDPSRRKEGRRVRSVDHYSPPLSFVSEIKTRITQLAVKVSPAIDDESLNAMQSRVEFISDQGECKEAVMWFGDFGPKSDRSATILREGTEPQACILSADPEAISPPIAHPDGWLLEPDPAIIRAGLIPEAAHLLNASLLEPGIAYLTASHPIQSPYAAAYQIVEVQPFHLKNLQRRLRGLNRKAMVVKKRGVKIEPEALLKSLPARGDIPTVILLMHIAGRIMAILCDPPVS
jgi:hypothetical protein